MSSNWRNWLGRSPKEREQDDTIALLGRASAARQHYVLGTPDDRGAFIVDLIFEICERCGATPSTHLGEALFNAIEELLYLEGFVIALPEAAQVSKLTVEEGVAFRAQLSRHLRFLDDADRLLPIWREKLVWVFSGMLQYFPASAFTDIDERGVASDDSVVLPEAKAFDLCDNLPEVLDRLLITFFDDDVLRAHVFDSLREALDRNAHHASGLDPTSREESGRKVVMPSGNRNSDPEFLIEAYLQGTPFRAFFRSPLPFAIPFPARFEHTHIVGGTGHGKTQLMQFLIHHDLVRSAEDGRSVVVIDSQGDLIRTISRLGYFSPRLEGGLSDRFVLIDPTDVEHPACLNMFDFNRSRLSGYSALDREKILNATVELYEYFFGALLGAELTQRQGLIFRYLARLLVEIPGATVHTLRQLMEDGEPFRPYMEALSGTARSFFATRFFDRSFGETKKQILTRLWGVLSNATLERMFSHSESKVDLFDFLNSGKIVLINTAKDLLGQEGASIFGRFFIALIAQAAVQRSALPPHQRRPAFVYIDEAHDYFDENISHLLNQARKYRVGLVFAHQNLDQLGAGLRSSVLSSTSIKFAGGVSAKDANTLDTEFRCSPELLLSQRKGKKQTEFACHIRNYTNRGVSVSIPLGFVEAIPTLDDEEEEVLLEQNRRRYTAPPELPPEVPFPQRAPQDAPRTAKRQPARSDPENAETAPAESAQALHTPSPVQPPAVTPTAAPERIQPSRPSTSSTPPAPPTPGRGGRQHKYLQRLIKELAEERGFRASIEEEILRGAGRVDVAISRGERRIAFEISVTTGKDWELGNVEKCLEAGFAEVVLVGRNARHVKALSKFIEENLDERLHGKVRFAVPEQIVEFLDSVEGADSRQTERTVRGYKVRTVRQVLDPGDSEARRAAIAEVVAKSISRQEK